VSACPTMNYFHVAVSWYVDVSVIRQVKPRLMAHSPVPMKKLVQKGICTVLSGTVLCVAFLEQNPPKYWYFDIILKFLGPLCPPPFTDYGQILHAGACPWCPLLYQILLGLAYVLTSGLCPLDHGACTRNILSRTTHALSSRLRHSNRGCHNHGYCKCFDWLWSRLAASLCTSCLTTCYQATHCRPNVLNLINI